MNQIAADFLTRSFASSETIALLLRRENAPRPQQRVVRLEQVLAPRYMAWLTYENDDGTNIYVSANPLRPGSRKRTKECIASVRHLYIDIDTDGDARLAALRASDRFLRRPRFSRLRQANTRCSGGSQASASSAGRDAQAARPSPSVAIQLAPTATGCCAFPAS